MRIIDLALKDLAQLVRDWKSAFFLLIMPIGFTLLFGFVFGGVGSGEDDPRLPVGYIDSDNGIISPHLLGLIEMSDVIRLEIGEDVDSMTGRVEDEELVAVVHVPAGYSDKFVAGEPLQLTIIANVDTNAGMTAQTEIQKALNRLVGAVRTAQISTTSYESTQSFDDQSGKQDYFNAALERSINAWNDPPVTLAISQTGESAEEDESSGNAFIHASPGMMAQFAVAGLIGAAEVLVLERKNGTLQRMLTTSIRRPEILLGHYLAMLVLVFIPLLLLALFGHLFLQLDYFSQPLATLLILFTTGLFAASLGLLIGSLAKTEEQVIILVLFPMFVLAGLGGAWVPLEFTSETVQFIGHLSPIAWVMDGLKNILIRGQGLEAALLPAGVLVGFAVVLFLLGIWRFKFE
jgi:ABC-2 type transport system permease protein